MSSAKKDDTDEKVSKYKGWFTFFGVLDTLSFLKNLSAYYFIFKFSDFSGIPAWLNLLALLLVPLLVFLFFAKKKIALTIYYFHFPLKLIFALPSFWFLSNFVTHPATTTASIVIVIILLLEIGRLIMTIRLHVLLNRHKKQMSGDVDILDDDRSDIE